MLNTIDDFEDAIGRPYPEGASRQIRLAVVGLDAHGADYEWDLHPNATVAAVMESDPVLRKRLRDRYQCDAEFESLDALLRGGLKLDAVAIFTGIPERFHDSMRCMELGLHVLTEVPACGTLEEAAMLVETKERTGMRYMLGETTWYWEETIYARALYQLGVLGEIYYTESEYNHDLGDLNALLTNKSSHLRYHADGTPTWRWGFPLTFYATHALAYVTGITGDRVLSVSALGWGDGSHPYLTDNRYDNPFWNESALFELEHGHMARWNGFHLTASSANRASIFGDKAAFHTPRRGVHGSVALHRSGRETAGGDIIEIPKVFGQSKMLPSTMRRAENPRGAPFATAEFINAIIEDREPRIDVYHAVAMTVPGLVAHESALRGGERLKAPQFPRPETRA